MSEKTISLALSVAAWIIFAYMMHTLGGALGDSSVSMRPGGHTPEMINRWPRVILNVKSVESESSNPPVVHIMISTDSSNFFSWAEFQPVITNGSWKTAILFYKME